MQRAGFSFDHQEQTGFGWNHDTRAVMLPLWFLVFLTSLLPMRWAEASARALRQRVKRSRAEHGMCPNCAYDLTANRSGVCPECGTAVAKEAMP